MGRANGGAKGAPDRPLSGSSTPALQTDAVNPEILTTYNTTLPEFHSQEPALFWRRS